MVLLRRLGLVCTTLTLVGMSGPPVADGDPVVAARAQRAASLGLAVDDLPPVPRAIVEPPPLPPPEIHPKDLRPRRGVRSAGSRKTKAAAGKPVKKATPARKAAPAGKNARKPKRAAAK